MRRKFLLGTALAATLLGLFLYNTDFGELRDSLAQTSPWPLLLSGAIQVSTFYIRALRWRLLLGPLGRGIPLSSLNNVAAIGFMLNNFVPRGAGELARSYLLGRGYGVGMSATFATVLLERIFDFLTVLIMLAILLAGFELPAAETGLLTAERLRYAGWLVSSGTLALVVLLGLLYARSEAVLRMSRWLLRPFPERISSRVLGLLSTFIAGLSCLTSARAVFGVLFYSVLLWIMLLVTFPLVLDGFHLGLPVQAGMLLLVLSVFSMFVPAPGGVGAMHFAVQEGLKLYGILPPLSKAVAIGLHASGYIPVTLLGLVCLRLEGLNLGQLGKVEEEAEALAKEAPPAVALPEERRP